MTDRGPPPALILYDTAAEGEQFRGLPLSHRLRLLVPRLLYRHLLGRRRTAPATFFNPAAANVVAVERYRPRPYPGAMLLIRSTCTDVAAGVQSGSLGWDGLVGGTLTIRNVDVAHGDFFKPPHLSEIAAITLDYLRSGDPDWR